jgi:hypothetical protein
MNWPKKGWLFWSVSWVDGEDSNRTCLGAREMSQRGEKVRVCDHSVELGDDIPRGKEEQKAVEVVKRPEGEVQLRHLGLAIPHDFGRPRHGSHHGGDDGKLKVHLGSL